MLSLSHYISFPFLFKAIVLREIVLQGYGLSLQLERAGRGDERLWVRCAVDHSCTIGSYAIKKQQLYPVLPVRESRGKHSYFPDRNYCWGNYSSWSLSLIRFFNLEPKIFWGCFYTNLTVCVGQFMETSSVLSAAVFTGVLR